MIFDIALYTFVTLSSVIVATYLLYPFALLVVGPFIKGNAGETSDLLSSVEKVSIIICAHNEAGVIEDKLRSIANQNWTGAYEVILANDGSTDGTAELASQLAEDVSDLQILNFDRRGKWFVLNQAADKATGDVLVFTDADTIWGHNALQELMQPFKDLNIGCVAGNIISRKSQTSSAAGFDQLFRFYESTIRESEQYLAGCVSADGGLYAIRSSLFASVPPGVTDDFYISTGAVLKGKKIAFQPKAIAYEYAIAGEKKNLRRRIRITVRGLTSLRRRRALLNPIRFGFYSVALFFHKFLRRLSAVFILALFPLSLILVREHVIFGLLALGQAAVYATMLTSIISGKSLPGLGKVSMAALHIFGLGVGFILFASGKRFDRWAPSRSE